MSCDLLIGIMTCHEDDYYELVDLGIDFIPDTDRYMQDDRWEWEFEMSFEVSLELNKVINNFNELEMEYVHKEQEWKL